VVETQFEDWRNGNETRPQSPPFITICMPSFGGVPPPKRRGAPTQTVTVYVAWEAFSITTPNWSRALFFEITILNIVLLMEI